MPNQALLFHGNQRSAAPAPFPEDIAVAVLCNITGKFSDDAFQKAFGNAAVRWEGIFLPFVYDQRYGYCPCIENNIRPWFVIHNMIRPISNMDRKWLEPGAGAKGGYARAKFQAFTPVMQEKLLEIAREIMTLSKV